MLEQEQQREKKGQNLEQSPLLGPLILMELRRVPEPLSFFGRILPEPQEYGLQNL